MKNYIQDGKVIDITLAATIASGAALLIGTVLGVAQKSGNVGDTVGFLTEGVFDLPYGVNAAITVGALMYWDDTAKGVTKTTTSNTKCGVAVKAAAANAATVRVRLVPTL